MKVFIFSFCVLFLVSCGGRQAGQGEMSGPLAEDILAQLPEQCLPKYVEDGVQTLLEQWDPAEPNIIVWGRTMGDIDGEGITVRFHPCKEPGQWLVIYLHHMGQYELALLSHRSFLYSEGQLAEIDWPIAEPTYEDFATAEAEALVDPDCLETIQEEWTVNYDYVFSTDDYLTASLFFFDEADYLDDDYDLGSEAFCEACRHLEYHWDGEWFEMVAH